MSHSLQVLTLGVLQGGTEFLPVSSSGHLALLQNMWSLPQEGLLAFDLLLHCATTLAVLLFFRKDIVVLASEWFKGFFQPQARQESGWRYGWYILAATVLTAIVALPLKNTVEAAMASRLAVGFALVLTGVLLSLVPLIPVQNKSLSLKIALFIGLAQGLAVFPGISRSGLTITAALFMGLSLTEAFRFSFLVAIPAIAGATILEAVKFSKNEQFILPAGWVLAVISAFVVGYFCLALLRRLVVSGKWAYFGFYCVLLGLFAIVSDLVTRF